MDPLLSPGELQLEQGHTQTDSHWRAFKTRCLRPQRKSASHPTTPRWRDILYISWLQGDGGRSDQRSFCNQTK